MKHPAVIQARYARARTEIGAAAFDRELAKFRDWQRTVRRIHTDRAEAEAARERARAAQP